MKNDKEIVGTLLGFDDFVNMLLEDVTEYESTPEGRRITKLDQILLNGNSITMVCVNRTCFFAHIKIKAFHSIFISNTYFLSEREASSMTRCFLRMCYILFAIPLGDFLA
jgi:hypothetical protein